MRGTSLALASFAALAMPHGAFANDKLALAPAPELQSQESALQQWWDGKTIDGNWGGLRDTLEAHGINIGGSWLGNLYDNASGGTGTHHNPGRTTFDQQIKITLQVDFGKLISDELDGFSLYVQTRYRDGNDPGQYAGTSSLFDPSNYEGGKYWRLTQAYLSWTSKDRLWTKDALTISGGWMNPWYAFIYQPNALFFVNNALNSSRGIGGNIPWSSSFAEWGGIVKVKPVSWSYIQAGLFAANQYATKTSVVYKGRTVSNYGLPFAGEPYDAQGVTFIAEAGVTPKIGPDQLEGKYAVGFDYWGLDNVGYVNKDFYDNHLNYYVTADQMLFREPSAEGNTTTYDKDGKAVVSSKQGKLSDQGLYFCGMANFAKSENNLYPFYFQAGLVYKGLIPTRDNDKLGAMFGYGQYSSDAAYSNLIQSKANQDMESVLAVNYQFQINKWAYVKPFYQWIQRPGGKGLWQDDQIIGVQAGVTF